MSHLHVAENLGSKEHACTQVKAETLRDTGADRKLPCWLAASKRRME